MQSKTRRSSQARRAVLLGVAIAAAAYVPPLLLAQRLDSQILRTWDRLFSAAPVHRIEIIDLGSTDLLTKLALAADPAGRGAIEADDAALAPEDPISAAADDAGLSPATAVSATILGPTAIALGPLRSSAWGNFGAWAFGLIAAGFLATRRDRLSTAGWLYGVGGTAGLLGTSAAAFALAQFWIPAAGPALMLLTAGTVVLLRPRRKPRAAEPVAYAADAAVATELLAAGDLTGAWQRYRDESPTAALLPELYELGTRLADEGYGQLAADTYCRIALVDPDYRDVVPRLVRARNPEQLVDDEALAEQLHRQMPATLGRYRLLEPVGQGTTGQVFLARDPDINRLVAIKLIDLALERDATEVADAKDRFRREAETTGRLSHPNIVTIYDIGESDDRAYIAMEYLKGELLSRFTSAETLLPPRLVLELGAKTADALDYAHSQNVIHRDIKPSNIMYDSVTGELKITDFGIARLIDVSRTRTGVVLGTPSFMSPEQIEGGNVNGHTDLFALGVSLYELLTGQLPFRGASMTQLMFVIANEPHEPVSAARPGLPAELDDVMQTALSKDPGDRFRRGADMADALRAVARRVE